MNFQTLDQILKVCFEFAWQTSLQATILIGLVMLIQVLFKRMLSPRWRYLFGLLVLLRLVIPVVPASPFSIFNVGERISLNQPTLSESIPIILPQPSLPEVPVRVVPKSISAAFFAKYLWLVGCVSILVVIARQHRRVSRCVQRHPQVVDPKVLALLENCQALLGIKRRVRVVSTDTLTSPALFGVWSPCLLVPEKMLSSHEHRELRLIFLHELIHLKNGDIALNWFMIMAGSLHWFNPAVWLACKRLRADQEMACDAAVMTLLAADERQLYGITLINMAEAFSAGKLCPTLAPFITKNHIIKRRIIMISKFKTTSRIAFIASAVLFVVLGSVTFTRARNSLPSDTQKDAADRNPAAFQDGIQEFQKEIRSQGDKIREKELELNELQAKLGTPPNIPENKNPFRASLETPQTIRYASVLIEAETQWAKDQKLLSELQALDPNALRQAVPTAVPDSILTTLSQNYNEAETRLITLRSDLGTNHPDALRTQTLITKLNKEIDVRLTGILEGLRICVAARKATMDNCEEMMQKIHKATAKIQEAEASKLNIPQAWWPYFRARADLDRLMKFRDVLFLRMAQENVNVKAGYPDVIATPR